MLGIQAQKQEVSLVFKCLDRTGNGIKIDEFKKLVAGDSNSYLKDNEQLLHMMTHERRASRIRSASMKVKKKSPNPIAVSPESPRRTTSCRAGRTHRRLWRQRISDLDATRPSALPRGSAPLQQIRAETHNPLFIFF